jgi:hypothetical protein
MAKKKNETTNTFKPTEAEETRLHETYERFEHARDAREHVDQHFETNEAQWEGYFGDEIEDVSRDSTGEYRSNIWVPMTFWLTMAAMTEYIQQNPAIMLLPSGDEDAAFADIMQEITNYSMEKGNFIVQMYKTFLDASIFGTCPIYEYYRCDNRIVKELSEYNPETMKTKYKKQERTVFKDVYAESFSPYHFYPEPFAESMDTCNYAFRRFVFYKDDFHSLYDKKFKHGKNVLTAQEHLTSTPDWKWWDTSGLGYLEDNQIEVLWEWNKPKDEMNVMANGVLLTKPDMPIPYDHKEIPIAVINSTMRSRRLWGKGMSEVLEKLQFERNATRNMALDQMKLNILKVFFINPDAGLTDDQLKLKPGVAIPVKGDPRNSVFPLEYSGLKGERYKEEEMMDSDAVRATGISPELTGVSQADSATQAAIMKEATLKRIRLQMTMAYEDGLTRLGRLRLSNIQQFYRDPLKVKKIIGEDGTEAITKEYRKIRLKDKALAIDEVTGQWYLQNTDDNKFHFFQVLPELLQNEDENKFYSFDVKVDPNSAIKMSKSLELERDDAFYDKHKDNPLVNQSKLLEDNMKAHDKNPDDFLIKELPPGLAPPAGGEGVNPLAQAGVTGGPVTRSSPSASEAQAVSRVIPSLNAQNL